MFGLLTNNKNAQRWKSWYFLDSQSLAPNTTFLTGHCYHLEKTYVNARRKMVSFDLRLFFFYFIVWENWEMKWLEQDTHKSHKWQYQNLHQICVSKKRKKKIRRKKKKNCSVSCFPACPIYHHFLYLPPLQIFTNIPQSRALHFYLWRAVQW